MNAFFLQSVTVSELDRLLGLVVDVENLLMYVHKEEDGNTKQFYYFLFKLLRISILHPGFKTDLQRSTVTLSFLMVYHVFLSQNVELMLSFERLCSFLFSEMKYFEPVF